MKHIKTFEGFSTNEEVSLVDYMVNKLTESLDENNQAIEVPVILTIEELKKKSKKELQDINDEVVNYLNDVLKRFKAAKGAEKKELEYSAGDIIRYHDMIKMALNSK
jgi:hypothetical protein